jgi:hypothetical protein
MRTRVGVSISSLIALAILLVAAACGDNTQSSSKQLTGFSFLAANNPGLTSDVAATISGTEIRATLPYGTALASLVATYTSTGESVYVDKTAQASGVTANSFAQSIDYVVSAKDHSTTTYTVSVAVASSSAKALTSFAFLAVNNPGLANDVFATISGSSIAATLPYGTDPASLTPTFATTGVAVYVGSASQINGHSAVNFSSMVTYTVVAADKSTQTYYVKTQIAANPAKAITMFELTSALNAGAGVSSTMAATISGGSIGMTVPYGTNVTALVATFSTDGQTVTVDTVVQVSGLTPNDFTHPVTYVVTAADGSTKSFTVTITVAKNPAKALTAFSFTSALNSGAGISTDVVATISGTQIGATVPFGTDLTALVATFSTTGASVAVGSAAQVSGSSADNFSSAVTYTVTAADSTTQSYVVTVTVAESPAKQLTAFEFTSALNGDAGVSSDSIGTINGTAIAVTVPYGTDVTALVATFTTTGNSVAVSGTAQASGVTANDFTSAVDYTVTAQDGTTKDFIVTVTVALNPAKAITAFAFLSADNSAAALSSDVVATISGTAITATVPYGTDATQLVADFSTTGASVAVGSAAQQSDVTANDFTNEVDYVVTAADGTSQTYAVTVTVALSPAKDITAFEFTSALDGTAGVTFDAIGTISGTSISVYVPYGTDLTALVATFTTTGASVAVGSTQEQSGVTANDFTNPVSYVVTAADGSTQTYSVTVAALSYATGSLTMPDYDDDDEWPPPYVPGTKLLVFLFAPAGTQLNSDADYKAYCESFGFEQNQDSASYFETDSAGMYNSTDYYCIDACCYLGAGNGGSQYISSFANYGLPLNTPLQVFDRGCGDAFGGYSNSLNTTDTVSVTSSSTFSYTDNENEGQSKSTTFASDGVVVCETK